LGEELEDNFDIFLFFFSSGTLAFSHSLRNSNIRDYFGNVDY